MPQFIAPDSNAKIAAFVVLGLTFVTTGTIWCLVLAVAGGKLRGFFASHPKGWRTVSRASGALFMALGLRLAMTRQ
jgi:threonine/homoserine/homoserine lactone efflux protein